MNAKTVDTSWSVGSDAYSLQPSKRESFELTHGRLRKIRNQSTCDVAASCKASPHEPDDFVAVFDDCCPTAAALADSPVKCGAPLPK